MYGGVVRRGLRSEFQCANRIARTAERLIKARCESLAGGVARFGGESFLHPCERFFRVAGVEFQARHSELRERQAQRGPIGFFRFARLAEPFEAASEVSASPHVRRVSLHGLAKPACGEIRVRAAVLLLPAGQVSAAHELHRHPADSF